MSKLIDTDLNDNQLAQTFAKAGYWQDAQDPAKAMVKILGGREIGVGPMAAMREINIIKGKIELSASLMARLVKESDKYDYRVIEHDEEKCVIKFYQVGHKGELEEIGKSEFSMEDAKEAGLVRENSPWEKYPKNMLFARALSNGVKWHCPDVTGGAAYHEGELSGEINDGEAVVDVEPEIHEEPGNDSDETDYSPAGGQGEQEESGIVSRAQTALEEASIEEGEFFDFLADSDDHEYGDVEGWADLPRQLIEAVPERIESLQSEFVQWKHGGDVPDGEPEPLEG